MLNYDEIVLQKLKLEWINREDHDAQQWIVRKNEQREVKNQKILEANGQGKKRKPLRPPLDRDECERWRSHFTATREAFVMLQKWEWRDIFLKVVSKRDTWVRSCDNPVFLGALLNLLDRRPYTYIHLERHLDIPTGHMIRFFKRGGILWKSMMEGERGDDSAIEKQRVVANGTFFPIPQDGIVIHRSKVVHTDRFDVVDAPYDPRAVIPTPMRRAHFGMWLRLASKRRPSRGRVIGELQSELTQLHENHLLASHLLEHPAPELGAVLKPLQRPNFLP